MDEKPKRAIDRAAWFVIGVWIVLLRFILAPTASGLWVILCPSVIVVLIATWIGWFCGLNRGNAGRGAFYGLASGLLLITAFGLVVIVAAGQQGRL